MRSTLLPVLATAFLPCALVAQSWPLLSARALPVHSQAAINDPRSHGAIGDRWLSLAEAILLTNRDIDENALSAEEVAQLSGFGGDIAWADIDATIVPLLTLERDLPILTDTPHGFTVHGANGTPTIDLRDTRGIVARSDYVDFSNLRLLGGAHGIDMIQDDSLFGSLIENVEFEGQGVAGLRIGGLSAAGNTRVQIAGCRFRSLRAAIVFDDLGDSRTGQFEIFGDTRIDDCGKGVDLTLGTRGSLSLYVEGLVAVGCGDAFRIRSAGSPGRTLLFEGRYARLEGSRSALSIWGDRGAGSAFRLQNLDLRLTQPGMTLEVGPLGTPLDLTLQDSRWSGEARVLGGSSGRIVIENSIVDGRAQGIVDLGTTGAPLTVDDSVLDGVDLRSSGSAGIRIRRGRLIGATATGTSAAPITLEDGHHDGGTTLGAHVQVLRPLTAPHLGRFDAAPPEPPIGTVLTLSADLPTGLEGRIVLGRTVDYPSTLPSGLRIYADGAALAMVPTPLLGQASLPVSIPALPALTGLDLFFHLAVFPQPGATAPALWLPPGRRVRIR